MDYYLNLTEEYALRAYYSVSMPWVTMISLSMIMAIMVIYYHSQFHEDRAVSKRSTRARHKRAMVVADEAITGALEAAHRQGKLDRKEVDDLYRKIKKSIPGFKELGPEPSFGKPWYYGPALPKNISAVKSAIINRLKNTKEKWDTKDRIDKMKAARDDQAALVASIKSKS